jgi:hypothetical protein
MLTGNPSTQVIPGDVTREVAPKPIPKKEVKRRQDGGVERDAGPQGLDHPNIVRPISFSLPPPFLI